MTPVPKPAETKGATGDLDRIGDNKVNELDPSRLVEEVRRIRNDLYGKEGMQKAVENLLEDVYGVNEGRRVRTGLRQDVAHLTTVIQDFTQMLDRLQAVLGFLQKIAAFFGLTTLGGILAIIALIAGR